MATHYDEYSFPPNTTAHTQHVSGDRGNPTTSDLSVGLPRSQNNQPAQTLEYMSWDYPEENVQVTDIQFMPYYPTAAAPGATFGYYMATNDAGQGPLSYQAVPPNRSITYAVPESPNSDAAIGEPNRPYFNPGIPPAQFVGNIHEGVGQQRLGLYRTGEDDATEEQALNATRNIHAYENIHRGTGDQSMGLTVDGGGTPTAVAGLYNCNVKQGEGHQVIGQAWIGKQSGGASSH
ncbi:hypothetical protein F4677DRAFT_427536 [Hypoxylon crocopeplum]|nr:hypothetical protein F4677DRAFT_427536 [Hypoxylon crocopeplum]